MPELVMENIIGLLNFRSVLTLRHVCKDLMNFVDKLNDSKLPESKFSKIEIDVNSDIYITYGNLATSIYSESDNSRMFNRKGTFLGNSNIVDVAIRDLEQVLKFQKSTLSEFHFRDHQSLNDSKFSNFHVKLSNIFKKLNRKIRTTKLFVTLGNQSEYMSILPFFDSETLEQLVLDTVDNQMQIEIDEIVKTEQWKEANSIFCDFYALNMTVEDISDLQKFSFKMLSISARDLDFLKKIITNSSKFEYSFLHMKYFNEYEEISNIWGPPFHYGSESQWYFRMKNSEENILQIENDRGYHLFSFHKIEIREVPYGTIVQDYNEN
ncbi:hypothetical protein B9Z55_021284 [Caenorhabditis nigoni]|nr:hypothetical protein B9Z55_021284 [Caenorhabditis nigoni]